MRFGIEVVNFGQYADARPLMELARAAEASGWEGFFVWDHVLGYPPGSPAGHAWTQLTAVAAVTERLRIGSAVSPLPRYRPHLLAHAVATLDLLSGGRVILGAGLGPTHDVREVTGFGDDPDPKVRAAKADEALEIITKLWSGESVTHHGQHYTIEDVTLRPVPTQRPRVPIWIGGFSAPAFRRAARWDGWVIGNVNADASMDRDPGEIARAVQAILQHRASNEPFDVAMTGATIAGERSLPAEFAAAGVTWWLESLFGWRGTHDEMMARVKAGPPS